MRLNYSILMVSLVKITQPKMLEDTLLTWETVKMRKHRIIKILSMGNGKNTVKVHGKNGSRRVNLISLFFLMIFKEIFILRAKGVHYI